MVRREDNDKFDTNEPDANRDPISGAPGAHPVGAGLGAAGGAAAGAALGALGGPVGAVAGAVIGGVAGGLGGKAAAEAVNPTVEDSYWREHYITEPYVDRHDSYDNWQPAYRYGWESYGQHRNDVTSFDEIEPRLANDWDRVRGSSSVTWDRAKSAARSAWDRLERAIPGDADGDGR